MGQITLLEFATDNRLAILLIKERAKCRRRNRDAKKPHILDRECDIDDLSSRKMLSRLMPPRRQWVTPSKRAKLRNGATDTSKNAEKALLLTISRDRRLREKGASFPYLDEMDAFFSRIRKRLSSDDLQLEKPRLMPILKDTKEMGGGVLLVTCRPLCAYSRLEDKIILSLTSRYLTRVVDRYLHNGLLSYRPPRLFRGENHHRVDFNDGIELIKDFRNEHNDSDIYAADCDIKSFYDIIPHQVVRDCFWRLLNRTCLDEEGKGQVMKVVEAYLKSYNFYNDAWLKAQQDDSVYAKVRRRLHDHDKRNMYQLGWADEIKGKTEEELLHLGVPQGGALSLLVANIVLNDVDRVFTENEDPNRLFMRFCDDMILLHTDYEECCRLMERYAESLREHGLYYHDFKCVADCSRREFWGIKSHRPFLWGEGEDNSNSYIGFLGYELRRDGKMRLRKSNIERFKEKFDRQRYALRRYSKKHTPEETEQHQKKVLDNILNGVAFYTAFNQSAFKKSRQFKYLEKLRDRLKKGNISES